MPESAIFGRLGGEEFAIALPATALAAALALAGTLRTAVAARTVATPDGHAIAFTASIGLAMMDARDADVDAVLKRCDEALYRAKREGRDRVALHGRGGATAMP